MKLDSHNNYKQMQNTLMNLAEEVIRGGERGPQANLHFRSLINEVRNLDQCLFCLKHSDNFAFVYCSNMIKLIQSGEFCIISETKSEQNVLSLLDNLNSTKMKVYGHIISELVGVILFTNKPSYLSKTIKDLIALCLKALFEDSSFFQYLQKFVNYFLPHYQFIESFNSPIQAVLTSIEARYNLDYNLLNNYCILLEILTSMFEFVTVQTTSKSYYEYRRSIYVFRNAYLAHFLYFAVQNWKIVFLNRNESLRDVMRLTIEFMQHVFLYPFTLSLHEFQLQEDSNDNISNGSNDLYFPSFFRHALCDIAFLQSIQEYTYVVINNDQSYEQKRSQLNSLVKILGRTCCPSQYTFKNDEEKQYCRQFSITIIKRLSEKYRYSETYYLNTIMDIFYKMLTIFDFYFSANRSIIIYSMLQFLFRVMQQAEIKIDEGKRSPFARTFELLAISLEYSKDRSDQQFVNNVKFTSQKILQKAFERLLSPQANQIMYNFGVNQPTQIQCFCQLFQFVGAVFQSSLQTNLNIMQNVNLNILTPGSIVIWLHLCAQLIPKTTANLHQTRIILKYYQLAKNGNSLSSLRYIRTFVEEVMSQFNEDIPSNPLWSNIQQLNPVSFENLIMSIIAICVNNFKDNTSNEVLDYSLQLFKTIYITLKKFDSKAFVQFYNIVQQLLRGIQQTVFAIPKYFSKRQDFFNVISIIWINSDNLDFVYKIDSLIKNNLRNNSAQSFFQYLHDITGLIEPLDHHQAFQVLTELALDELNKQFAIHLNNQVQTKRFFKEPYFMKIFCRLVYALISDINRKLFFQTHTKIPLRIHKLFFPYIKFITQSEDYEYPKNFANILQRMVNLNPLSQIVNFSGILKTLKEQSSEHFDRLVRMYFEHIHRVADITWMYDLIGGNPDYMANWWQQAMLRNLHPKVNFRVIAESRFWTNNRQKETFAKLLFELGYYDNQYWNVDGFESERMFVQQFSKVFA